MPFEKGWEGGPGRPRKADKHAGAIAKAEKQIADRLPLLIEKMFELANGVTVTDVNIVTGETTVYEKPPDRAAIQYLVDRIMGKPTERQEVTGADGEPLFKVYEGIDPSKV
jgi:hypothetical protein